MIDDVWIWFCGVLNFGIYIFGVFVVGSWKVVGSFDFVLICWWCLSVVIDFEGDE